MLNFDFLNQYSIEEMSVPKKVIVGMSGGVDSAVAALILKAQGHEVTGVFMKNWDEIDENGNCTAEQDFQDVIAVCETLDIPYYSFNFVEEYREKVFNQFIEDYKQGLTPNPDIFCNKEIKFNHFYENCLKLGADLIATGHYCRTIEKDGEKLLAKGRDPKKDQSYFLAGIDQSVLQKVLFPLGDLLKTEIRTIATHYNLPVKDKKDSTGVCFIGERNFRNFLQEYIESQKGQFMTPEGEVVGEHEGMCFYTLGQRKGLGLGGPGNPWYVVKKDIEKNIVYVARDKYHPFLMNDSLEATPVNILSNYKNKSFDCTAKIRYRQQDQECRVKFQNGKIIADFKEPQRGICPKQYVAFYDDDICLGGGVISI